MEQNKTWVIGVVALVVGVVAGYFFAQSETRKLKQQVTSFETQVSELETQMAGKVSDLESQLADAVKKAEKSVADLASAKTDADEKAELIKVRDTTIKDLESGRKESRSDDGRAQDPAGQQRRENQDDRDAQVQDFGT